MTIEEYPTKADAPAWRRRKPVDGDVVAPRARLLLTTLGGDQLTALNGSDLYVLPNG